MGLGGHPGPRGAHCFRPTGSCLLGVWDREVEMLPPLAMGSLSGDWAGAEHKAGYSQVSAEGTGSRACRRGEEARKGMSEEAGLEGVSSGASETGREGGGRGGEGLGGVRGEGEGRGEGRLPDFSLVLSGPCGSEGHS